MIYLLHGDDITSSRKYYSGLVEGLTQTIFDGKSLSLSDLEEKLVSNSLFEEKKAVVVENLLTKNAKKKDFVKFLSENPTQILLILWEDKKVQNTVFTPLKEATIKEFSLPQNYFQFLDSYAPGNGKQVFKIYHDLLITMNEELVFYSLLKRIRLLVVLSEGSTISEISKMAPWQVGKLNNQLRLWKKEALITFYKTLQETEIKMKSGGLPVKLSKHLDILILTLLT